MKAYNFVMRRIQAAAQALTFWGGIYLAYQAYVAITGDQSFPFASQRWFLTGAVCASFLHIGEKLDEKEKP